MKVLVTLLSILFSVPSFGDPFSITVDGKKKPVQILKFKEIHLSKSCFAIGKIKDSIPPKCDAFNKLLEKIKVTHLTVPLTSNPAVVFCAYVGGTSRVLENNLKNEFDYCEFKDQSLIDSWDLYLHFHPKK